MPTVFFSDAEIADLFDGRKPFNPSRVSLEVLRSSVFRKCDSVELVGVTFGGHSLPIGHLVGIQSGLVLFAAGSGLCSVDPELLSFPDIQLCSGIARYKPPRGVFEVERFAVMQSCTARMDVITSRPRPHQHLDGMAGYVICGVSRDELAFPIHGIEQGTWDQVVALLNEYLHDPVT